MKQSIELIIRIICILILIGLNLGVYLNGKSLDCNKCTVNFQSYKTDFKEAFNHPAQEFSIKIIDIYNKFLNNQSCLVKYTEEGYIYDYRKAEQSP